jgi:TorA maturation chaperone TorD
MARHQGEQYASQSDFWLCLARAFAPPAAGDYHRAFTEDLPSDLDAIALEIGLNVTKELEGFSVAARFLPDALELQRLYAALFVTPPVPVIMNTAVYLDHAFLGPSENDLSDWYARHGFERHPEFRDLNDHVAVQFEFIGLLYRKAADRAFAGEEMEALAFATEAERFMPQHPKRWITAFLGTLEAACAERQLNIVYVHLTRIAWHAIEHHLQASAVRFEVDEGSYPKGSARGTGPLNAADLAEIAYRLQCSGLGFDHVKALPEWSDAAFGARLAQGDAMVPPALEGRT